MPSLFINNHNSGWRVTIGTLLVFITMGLTPVSAIDPIEFDSPAEEQRFNNLAEELRCLVCQNQSLADSNAGLAQDLRREVLGLMKQGKSDKEIIDFLASRYSDFVLYRPQFKTSTLILWFGPFLLGIFAVGFLVFVIKQRNKKPATVLTSEDQTRLQQVFEKNKKDNIDS